MRKYYYYSPRLNILLYIKTNQKIDSEGWVFYETNRGRVYANLYYEQKFKNVVV